MLSSSHAGSSPRGATPPHRTGLVIDVDSHSARAILIARVDGQSRFISGATVPSTAMAPIDDVSVGARQALRAVEEHTGLRVVGPDGVDTPSSGDHGVDLFAITGQPVAPIRLSLLALGESALVSPLITAARRTLTTVDTLSERVRTSDGTLSGALMESAIREFRPDVLILAQGDAAEAEWPAATGTLTSLLHDDVAPLIIVVAGEQYQQQAAAILGEQADLRGIDPADFTPAEIATALESELQGLYEARVDPRALIASVERPRYVSRARAGDLVTRFLARRGEQAVVAIDIADGLSIHWATPSSSDVIFRPDIDLFRNIRAIFNGDLLQVAQWLPIPVSVEDLSHWILNRALRPRSVAGTAHDVAIERAILIELARSVWTTMAASAENKVDLIVGGRPFGALGSAGVAALTLLDIFQPDPDGGLVEIVIDQDGLLPAAGALGEQNPAMAADLVENDLLAPFGTAIIVRGGGSEGELAVRGQLRYEDGETTRFTVQSGNIHCVAPTDGRTATMTIGCEGSYTIGGYQQLPDFTIGPEGTLQAGEIGVIIDARGRPMRSGGDAVARAARISTWLEHVGLRA